MKQLEAIVRGARDWQHILNKYSHDPDLLQQIISYRKEVIFQTVAEVIRQDPELQEIGIYLGCGKAAILGKPVDIIVAGSKDLTSDLDLTFSAPAGRENLEVIAVESFNEIFREKWGREPGIVFDTNVYTSGHMRPVAFRGDSLKLNLVNKLTNKLEAIEDEGNSPTTEQRTEVNHLVSRINGLQDVTITNSLPQLEISNFEAFSERVNRLRTLLQDTVRKQYQTSKKSYGLGQKFNKLANVMSLVHMREFLHQQEWIHLEEHLTSEELSTNVRNFYQECLDSAKQIHNQLVKERQNRIDVLRQKFPHFSEANLKMRAGNELYVEYLQKFGNQLNQLNDIRSVEKAGTSPETLENMRLELQELQSKALFFANEAYMTPIAVEQVVLNQQIGLDVELPTAQYPASINEQISFVYEQINCNPDNFGRALWKTAKYADRILTAVRIIYNQMGEEVPEKYLMEEVARLRPLVRTLLDIKKNSNLNDLQKDETAVNLVSEHLSVLDPTPSEWGRLLLDLSISINLQVQEYLIEQSH